MDEIVRRGMAKWPNVPAVYGWLSLDRRGNWLIKGERIPNPLVTEFIGRNYARDERGCWFFQNGPQRVFVNLNYAPFVFRVVSPDGKPLVLEAHNGQPVAEVKGAWLDEGGALLLETDLGAGIVHDRDLDRLPPHFIDANGNPLPEEALDALMDEAEHGRPVPLWLKVHDSNVKIEPIASRDAGGRFGFVAQPEPPAGEEVCR
jgi:DUF2946 family protein